MKWLALVTSSEMTALRGQLDAVERDDRARAADDAGRRARVVEAGRGRMIKQGAIDPAAGVRVDVRYLQRDDAGEDGVDQAVELGDAVPLGGVAELLRGRSGRGCRRRR